MNAVGEWNTTLDDGTFWSQITVIFWTNVRNEREKKRERETSHQGLKCQMKLYNWITNWKWVFVSLGDTKFHTFQQCWSNSHKKKAKHNKSHCRIFSVLSQQLTHHITFIRNRSRKLVLPKQSQYTNNNKRFGIDFPVAINLVVPAHA